MQLNSNWKKLFDILQKTERLIVGLMSGTSLDGLDIALCAIRGSGTSTRLDLQNFLTIPYSSDTKRQIKQVFSKREADLQMICLLNEKIGILHAELILATLTEWGLNANDVDVIASHGQTIFHAPKSLHGLTELPNGTLQIGDGDHIAVHTGIITISDFRQKHIAAGGEGAPLAVYGDYLLFSDPDEDRIMLNIGGIANFTFLPASNGNTAMFSTDVGPGNTIMDQFIQAHYPGKYFDEDGALAASGNVNDNLLNTLLGHQFLDAPFPKTTGPELFNLAYVEKAQRLSGTINLSKADVLATLNQFTARVIVKAIQRCAEKSNRTSVYLSGGGMHNPVLIKSLKEALPDISFYTTSDLGINPDAKEAVLFALLANETLVGEGLSIGNDKDVPPINMGKISFPR